MKSLIIGLARTGSSNNYVLNQDTKYISMCGTKPEVTFSIDCGQAEFIEVIDGLRYNDADPDSATPSISFFQKLTTKLFKDLKYLSIDKNDTEPLHVRLATTPLELAQIPFEFALSHAAFGGDDGASLFADSDKTIIFTREVRQETEVSYTWPSKYRVLFAWAAPTNEVPHHEHTTALQEVVQIFARPKANEPFPQPDIDSLLTVLPDASLESLEKKIAEAIAENNPYTHINILAHGRAIQKSTFQEFLLVLCKNGQNKIPERVTGEALAKKITSATNNYFPTILSLASCDSGNTGNTILPGGSLAYQLHNLGIPCVFASQFPLTQPGSIRLIKKLYGQLLSACDPRMALYDTRVDLKKEPSHDWASLVAYVRFPENIDNQLQDAQLKVVFGSMKTTNGWVEHVLKYFDQIPDDQKKNAFEEVSTRIDRSIDQLSSYLNESKTKSKLATKELKAEHFGLLGSAFKRKAEFLYHLSLMDPANAKERIDQSTTALKQAKDYYYSGYDSDITNHWTAMQYLSLKAALGESLQNDQETWILIKAIATKELEKANETSKALDGLWAAGTLAELYLLKPLTVTDERFQQESIASLSNAKQYLSKIKQSKNVDVIDSTARQFDRYISWWTNVYVGGHSKDVKEMAAQLRTEYLS